MLVQIAKKITKRKTFCLTVNTIRLHYNDHRTELAGGQIRNLVINTFCKASTDSGSLNKKNTFGLLSYEWSHSSSYFGVVK
jgi:hypothetical protein